MNWKHKLCLTLTLIIIILAVSPLITAWADCPSPPIVHLGYGPSATIDSTAIPGSKDNPAINLTNAHNICKECPGAAIYEYNPDMSYGYSYLERCRSYYPEDDGVPLAQPVAMVLLGLLAIVLLTWGIYMRRRLKRLRTD